jgi:hypothetical protein
MSELTPEAVALLDAARQNHGPSEDDRRRVLATLHASLGIGVPIALAPAAAEALGSGQGAVQAASSVNGASASLQGAGSAASSVAGSAGTSAASHVAAHGGTKGALSLAGKLLTWKAGKLLLASVALGSAVGIGASLAPRRAPEEAVTLASKSGQAAAFASARADAGTSSSPTPAPTSPSDREPTAVAAPPEVAVAETAAPALAEPTTLVAPSEPVLEPARLARASAHAHGNRHGARVHRAASTGHVAAAARSAIVASASVDEPVPPPPVEQPLAAPGQTSVPTEAEAPNELALIRKALTSLRDRDAGRALTLLEEHAARFPSGSFATERRGLHVVALCAAGRVSDGRRERAAFLKASASSPIAARVRGACNERDD